MKIFCFLDEVYSYNGENYISKYNSGRFLLNLKDKYELIFSFPVTDSNNDKIATKIPKEVQVVPLPYWNSIVNYYKNFNVLKKEITRIVEKEIDNCDVVWVRLPSPVGNLIIEVAKRKNKKVICHFATDILSAYKKYSGIKKYFAYLLGKYINVSTKKKIDNYQDIEILCTGQHLEDEYLHPTTKFFIDIESNIDFKSNNEINNNFIYVGRLMRSKGIEVLIEAWKMCNIENSYLYIVGHGEMENYVIEQSKKYSNIKYLGFVTGEDLKGIYNKCDTLIMPTTTFPEGFPRVIVEAWCSGLAVISTDVGGIKGIGKNNENLLFVEAGNLEQLKESILKVYKNDELLFNLQNGAKKSANIINKNAMIKLVSDCIEK